MDRPQGKTGRQPPAGVRGRTPGVARAEHILARVYAVVHRVLLLVYGSAALAAWLYVVAGAAATAHTLLRRGWPAPLRAHGVWGLWAEALCGAQLATLVDIALAHTRVVLAPTPAARARACAQRRPAAVHAGARVVVAVGLEALPLARRGTAAGTALLVHALVGGVAEAVRAVGRVAAALRRDGREPRALHVVRRVVAAGAVPVCAVAQGVLVAGVARQLVARAAHAGVYARVVAGTVAALLIGLGAVAAVVVARSAFAGLAAALHGEAQNENDDDEKDGKKRKAE